VDIGDHLQGEEGGSSNVHVIGVGRLQWAEDGGMGVWSNASITIPILIVVTSDHVSVELGDSIQC
jgi:hypothetical protein